MEKEEIFLTDEELKQVAHFVYSDTRRVADAATEKAARAIVNYLQGVYDARTSADGAGIKEGIGFALNSSKWKGEKC